ELVAASTAAARVGRIVNPSYSRQGAWVRRPLFQAHRRDHRHDAGVAEVVDRRAVYAGHFAHVAQVDRSTIAFGRIALQYEALAEEYVGGLEIERRGPATQLFDAVGDSVVVIVGQHLLDDS